jgi:DNA (cytosine-5)-methyltransferase 3A
MKVYSPFDGISIAQQALKELNIPVEKYYASEIDKYAISITQKNFPNTIQLGSVTDVKGEELNDIDLIIGGSPCQDLSIAKKNREGLKGSRSALFYDFVRLVKEVKPKYFILENVNSMPKEAKQIITEELWVIEPVMINAALVSAQNRKRLFWIGRLAGDTYEQVKIEQPEDKGILLKDILESEVNEKYYLNKDQHEKMKYIKGAKTFWSGKKEGSVEYPMNIERKSLTLLTSESGLNRSANCIRVGSLNSGGQADRIYSPDGKSVSLSALGGGRGAKTGLYEVKGVASRTYPRTKIESQVRKLTPIECERLQSLPDNYTAKGITEKGEVDISNTQRYKALGNGFNCEVIKHILNHIIKESER